MPLLLFLAVFASGTAALVAESVWFRGLGRGVGTSAEALAVVSAAFLGGLGLGAAIASRRVGRSTAPLRVAAACEVIAGVLVFLSPLAMAAVPSAHLAVLDLLGLEPGRSAWPAALVALPVLVLPTAFLGATLPFLVRGVVTNGVRRAGRWTGGLYGVNTLGAVVGTGAAVVFFLPRFGEIGSLRIAGGLNVVAAALILLAERPAAQGREQSVAAAPPSPPPPLAPPPGPGAAAPLRRVSIAELALFASGVFALGAEVAWFRLLDPLTGVHMYGFALLLAAVLVGTAIGGAVGGFVADRVRRPDLALANVIALGGAAVLGSIWLAGSVPYLAVRAGTEAAAAATAAGRSDVARQAGFDALAHAKLWASALCVAPALLVFSMAYPLAVKVRATDPRRAAAAVGSTYAWNTAGNVLGSLVAGFVLLPGVGGPRTLAILGGLGLATAVAIRLAAARPRRLWLATVPLAAIALLAAPGSGRRIDAAGPRLPEIVCLERWSSSWRIRDRDDLARFAETFGGTYPRPAGRPDAPPILPREGVMSSVGVLLERNTVRLRQGGLSESKFEPTDPDAGSETEVALGLVPYLAHPAPKRALCIGHGAGWTAETLLATPMQVDVAELEAAVLDVAEAYRGGPLAVRSAPNARLHVTDGRLLLRRAAARPDGERYDVIVSQPSHPWVPGAGHLFTREAYALARSALNRGGVFAQWLNLFSMTRELLHTALEAWRTVFTDSWVLVFHDELVLVGFDGKGVIDVPRWRRELSEGTVSVRAHAASLVEPADVLHRIALDGEGLARIVPPGTVPATDDDPRLEAGLAWLKFAAPDWERMDREKAAIRAELDGAFPPDLRRMIPDAGERDRLLARTVLRLMNDGSSDAAGIARRYLESREPALAFEGGAEGRRARAKDEILRLRAAKSAEERSVHALRARELFVAAIALAPTDPEPVLEFGEFLLGGDRAAEAAKTLTEAAERFPDDGRILAAAGDAIAKTGEVEQAEPWFRRALATTGVRPPKGTGLRAARIRLAAVPPEAGPDLRAAQARDALRADPSALDDEEALGQLQELEIQLAEPTDAGASKELARIAERLAELRQRRGRERLATAVSSAGSRHEAPDAAVEATDLLPDDPLAWRIRGRYELRAGRLAKAFDSFRRAVSLAKDQVAEAEQIAFWYRLEGKPVPDLRVEPRR